MSIEKQIEVWEDDDGWFYEGSEDGKFPRWRPICRRDAVSPERLRRQAARILAVAAVIEGES